MDSHLSVRMRKRRRSRKNLKEINLLVGPSRTPSASLPVSLVRSDRAWRERTFSTPTRYRNSAESFGLLKGRGWYPRPDRMPIV